MQEFPASFTSKSIRLQKSNEKMYSMLEAVEAAIIKNVLENMGNVGQALHTLQD